MNSEINKKTPAFIYAKEFKLSKVLGNLQAYKLATGDVKQTEIDEVRKQHGNNLGAIYGNLITKASLVKDNKRKGDVNEISKVAKRRKKRRETQNKPEKNAENVAEYDTPVVSLEATDEPLPLPDWLQKEDVEDEGKSALYESNDEISEDEKMDFFGLSHCPETRQDSTLYPTICSGETSSRPQLFSQLEIPRMTESKHPSQLSTYRCWKCNRRGHLSEHCTIPSSSELNANASFSGEKKCHRKASARVDLQDLFAQCRKLKHSTSASCKECGNTSNLAFCFECGLTLCDGRGHLIDHLLDFPSHTKIYSHKLQRLLKCSNSSCDVVDTKQLLTCSQCLSKTFDKHYSLVNATWSNRGLKAIANAITCEEHFHWHRMNCSSSFEENLFNEEKMRQLKLEHNGLLSEFFF